MTAPRLVVCLCAWLLPQLAAPANAEEGRRDRVTVKGPAGVKVPVVAKVPVAAAGAAWAERHEVAFARRELGASAAVLRSFAPAPAPRAPLAPFVIAGSGSIASHTAPPVSSRVWSVGDIGATMQLNGETPRPQIPERLYPFPQETDPAVKIPGAPPRRSFAFYKIGVRDEMDRGSARDSHAAADRYAAAGPPAESVYVVEVGHDADVVAYGKRYGDSGGEGGVLLGKLVEASGSALFKKDGQVSIVHNLDVKITRIALRIPGMSLSPFARAGFLLDLYPDGARRGTLFPGGGVNFTLKSSYAYPLRFSVLGAPEISIDPSRGPAQLGVRVMTGAEILMF